MIQVVRSLSISLTSLLISMGMAQAGNTLNITQAGNNSAVIVEQLGDENLLAIVLNGNSNTIIADQENGQTSHVDVQGNDNSAHVLQKGMGNKSATLNLIGDDNIATIIQEDDGEHQADVTLTNDGGANNFLLNQMGSTAKSYMLNQTCVTATGCSVSIYQY